MLNFKQILNELSGSFGDIGTDLPLILGLIATGIVDANSVLIVFGLMQILTGLIYKLPMPVQPLKYMAILMLSQKLPLEVFMAGGFMIAVLMFLINMTGLLERIKQLIPSLVIRGIQLGLALSLVLLSAKNYFPKYDNNDVVFSMALMVVGLVSLRLYKFPTALLLVVMSMIYASMTYFRPELVHMAFKLPTVNWDFKDHLWQGLVLLAIPQLALSLPNSVFATEQMVHDYFPEKKVSLKKIGYTYSIINFIAPFFGGIPVCHGAGGIAGHYALGARSGLSVIFYGTLYLVLGLFFSDSIHEAIKIFPMPLLGVILLFEAIAIFRITVKHVHSRLDFIIYAAIAMICVFVPNGFLWGLIIGIALVRLNLHDKLPHRF